MSPLAPVAGSLAHATGHDLGDLRDAVLPGLGSLTYIAIAIMVIYGLWMEGDRPGNDG